MITMMTISTMMRIISQVSPLECWAGSVRLPASVVDGALVPVASVAAGAVVPVVSVVAV